MESSQLSQPYQSPESYQEYMVLPDTFSDRPDLLETTKVVEETAGREALGLALGDIEEGSLEDLEETLGYFPLTSMPVEESDQLLTILLTHAYDLSREDAIRTILQHWEDDNPVERSKPILTELFFIRRLDDRVLAYICNMYRPLTDEEVAAGAQRKEIDAYKLLETLITGYPNEDEVAVAAERVITIYGEQPYIFWEGLWGIVAEQERTEGVPNAVMRQFVAVGRDETAPHAFKPPQMKDFGLGPRTGGRDLPLISELRVSTPPTPVFATPSDSEAANLLTEGLAARRPGGSGSTSDSLTPEQPGVLEDPELEAQRIEYRSTLALVDDDEKRRILRPLFVAKARYNSSEDEELFRILGPANVLVNNNLASDHRCSRYGGCRMFTCLCLENWDNEEGVVDERLDEHLATTNLDWFNGNCGICHYRIANRAFAVRRPSVDGGWFGCYCSWTHVLDSIPATEDNAVQIALVRSFITQMDRIGIQDRLVDPDDPQAPVPVEDEYLLPLTEVPVDFVDDTDPFDPEGAAIRFPLPPTLQLPFPIRLPFNPQPLSNAFESSNS